jgi:GNAT superfamily N-acetyltransferase
VTNPVTIRAFMPEDVEAVVDLLQEVSAYLPDADTTLSLAEAFTAQTNSYACVAIQDGRPVGFGSVFILRRLRGGLSAIVEDLVVAPPMRGNGIGRAIMIALLEFARERGCFKVTLEASISAEQFYCNAGFLKAGRVMKLIF